MFDIAANLHKKYYAYACTLYAWCFTPSEVHESILLAQKYTLSWGVFKIKSVAID